MAKMILEVGGVEQSLRWIEPGTFLMGSPPDELGRRQGERPQVEVTIPEGYWLGATPVTQAFWQAVMGDNPSQYKGDGCPVTGVSWNDCQGFLERLNEQFPDLGARIPTEAEWEYACRAGTTTATYAGDLQGGERDPVLDGIAWYSGNAQGRSQPVGQKAPNPWGLYDMLGNVCEWCEYTEDAKAHQDLRFVRGGPPGNSVRPGYARQHNLDVRAAWRYGTTNDVPSSQIGLRLACLRGGGNCSSPGYCRAARSTTLEVDRRYDNTGLRLACP